MRADPAIAQDAVRLWEHAACGLLVTAEDGTILRINRTLLRWLGHPEDALLGRRLQGLLSMAGRIFQQTQWGPTLHSQGSVAEVKVELVHSDGHCIPMLLNAVRREHAGVMAHELALFIAEDRHRYERELISARTLAEERLAQQLQVQSALTEVQGALRSAYEAAEQRAELAERMVGIASHDLRNPLSAIKMAAGVLQRHEPDPRQARMVAHINQSVDRAQRLIADLLDFTLAQVGRGIPVAPRPLDFHGLISSSVEELRMAFPDRQLRHERDGEGSFSADGDRLCQLLGNLVANAMAYGAPDGLVTVRSRFDEHSVSLSVHNVGEPLHDEQERLFEPMTRGRDTHTDPRNIGLGLFIVREIVKAHRGEVAVISTAEMGTTFIARFPRS
jgi:sigma-B regulation protein RsbU (phosphoserine phosphatase)